VAPTASAPAASAPAAPAAPEPPGILTGSRIPGVTTSLPPAAAPVHEDDPAVPAEGVYEIAPDHRSGYERALREAQVPAPHGAADPYAQQASSTPSPSTIARRPPGIAAASGEPPRGVTLVESLLQRAQDDFRAGRRDAASQALVEAAKAYEALDRLDSAATIFRSLGRGAQSPTAVMELWLPRCEKRPALAQGAPGACRLPDR